MLGRKRKTPRWRALLGGRAEGPMRRMRGLTDRMPDVRMPEVKMPRLRALANRLPDVHMPEMRMPKPLRREPPPKPLGMMAGIAAASAAAGAALGYIFDRDRGRARRAKLRAQTAATARRAGRGAAKVARGSAQHAGDLGKRMTHLRSREKQFDDATLAHKIESEVLGHLAGRINVNAENGVIYLRGGLDDADEILRIERGARKVRGVRGVRNMLHLAGTPAPNKIASLRASAQ